MKIILHPITKKVLVKNAESKFGSLVKAVVDIEKEIIVIGGELHADEESILLKRGSKQEFLWGINLYPKLTDENWIEFDSMINVRPSQNNYSRGVDDLKIRNKIIVVVNKLIK